MSAASVPPFHWSQVESTDYREYIANLRAIGCPEEVVRDIVVADVIQKDASRAAEIGKPVRTEYWRKSPSATLDPEAKEKLAALTREREGLLKALLGGSPSEQEYVNLVHLQVYGAERMLLFLPPERQAAALKALAESGYSAREQASLHAEPPRSMEEEWRDKREALSQVLTHAELEELRLRSSPTTQSLRCSLRYFECTPEEFRILTHRLETAVASGPNTIHHHMASVGREVFDAERAAEFEKVTDLYYLNVRRELEETGRPGSLADEAWSLVASGRESLERIREDRNAPASEREARALALRTEIEAKLASLLGPAARASLWERRPRRNAPPSHPADGPQSRDPSLT